MSSKPIAKLALDELRVTQARYAERAERARMVQRTAPGTSGRALEAGKLVRHYQEMADSYAAMIEAAEKR